MLHWIYCRPLWLIAVFIVLLLAIWTGLSILIKEKPWKVINIIALVAMIFVILDATLFGRSGETVEIILRPFFSFVEAKVQPELYRSMLMNIFLFVPLGLTLPFALPAKWKHNFFWAILIALGFSCIIEALQYFLALGRCEIDDVIMNTIGALLGALAYKISGTCKKTS